MYTKEELQFFKDHDIDPPSHDEHGTEDDVRKNLKPLVTTNWRQEGGWLVCDTDMGTLKQRIPTNKILIGVDKNNKPLLQTID